MGDSIAIWSKKPVQQKKIILDMMEAAYDSRLEFYFHGFEKCVDNDKEYYNPKSFTLCLDVPDNNPMIFHIETIEEQLSENGPWINTRFVNTKGVAIIEPFLYRLTCSEDVDWYMTFHFSYYYLKLNPDHFISVPDYIVDWELIQAAMTDGISENWFIRY